MNNTPGVIYAMPNSILTLIKRKNHKTYSGHSSRHGRPTGAIFVGLAKSTRKRRDKDHTCDAGTQRIHVPNLSLNPGAAQAYVCLQHE